MDAIDTTVMQRDVAEYEEHQFKLSGALEASIRADERERCAKLLDAEAEALDESPALSVARSVMWDCARLIRNATPDAPQPS